MLSVPDKLFAPHSVSEPAPTCESEPAPDKTPESDPPVAVLNTRDPALLITPANVPEFRELATINAPEAARERVPAKAFEPPIVNVPARIIKLPDPETAGANIPPYVSVLLNASVPELIVTLLAMDPVEPPVPICNVPPFTVVVPE